MEKYYIPEIEEFYIGFECEYNSGISINTEPSKWVKEITDQDLLNIIFDSWEHPDYEDEFKDSFRVKYLDKDDIESLKLPNNIIVTLKGISDVEIYINEATIEHRHFSGTIKNKSELKKLLKQLCIIK